MLARGPDFSGTANFPIYDAWERRICTRLALDWPLSATGTCRFWPHLLTVPARKPAKLALRNFLGFGHPPLAGARHKDPGASARSTLHHSVCRGWILLHRRGGGGGGAGGDRREARPRFDPFSSFYPPDSETLITFEHCLVLYIDRRCAFCRQDIGRCSGLAASSRLQPTRSYILEIGRVLHIVGVSVNQIGVDHPTASTIHARLAARPPYLRSFARSKRLRVLSGPPGQSCKPPVATTVR